jgi:hypothetical protein
MDDQLLRRVYHLLFHGVDARTRHGHRYPDAGVLFLHFVAVARNSSIRAVYPRSTWPLWARRIRVPSYSQAMRRLADDHTQRRLDEINAHLRAMLPESDHKALDGKPLVVGHFSKDADATRGRLDHQTWARGYKLHVLADARGAIDACLITGLRDGEATVARTMLEPMTLGGCVVRADANYDSNPLYAWVADRGGRLVAPRRKPGTGLGHHRQHPDRLAAIEELEGDPDRLKAHRRQRNRVEQTFAHLTNLPFGLSPLPNSVRRLSRVRQWVLAKIILYHLHLIARHASLNAAA